MTPFDNALCESFFASLECELPDRYTFKSQSDTQPAASRTLDLLAALSHAADFSVGCHCEDEARCHRSVLRQLLEARGARIG